MAENDPLVPS